tara:strand:+ start:280 stop:1689 length:1410 start_codon:yes stop_codon:yes gene_type:complete
MATLLTRKFKYTNARSFLELFNNNSDRIYCFMAKVDEWISNDPNPDTPVDKFTEDILHWDQIIGARRILLSDVSFVVPFNEWTSGSAYTPYEHDDADIFDRANPFFVASEVTSGVYNVYKCISNNSGETSINQPTAETTNGIIKNTGAGQDGLHWKFMYTISASDKAKFFAEDTDFMYVPVKNLTADDSSTQWDVQRDAIDGGVHHIKHASDTFAGYTAGHAVTLVGDGTGFVGAIASHAGVSTKKYVNITNPGTGYRKVTDVKVNSVSDSDLKAIISPISGHGFNPVTELGATALMVTCEFPVDIPDLGSDASSYNEYRKVGIVVNPIAKSSQFDDISSTGTTISSGTRFSDTTADQQIAINYTGTSIETTFTADEIITQSGTSSKGQIISIDTINNIIYAITTEGEFDASNDITDSESNTLASADISSVSVDYSVKRYSGDIIYIDQRTSVTRTSTNKETVRLVIQF